MSPIFDHLELIVDHMSLIFGILGPTSKHLSTKTEPRWAKMPILSPKREGDPVRVFGSRGGGDPWGAS